MGFHLETAFSKGYMLSEDNIPFNGFEIRSGLKTQIIGRTLHFYEELESTNDTAFMLAKSSAHEGTAVIADFQRIGRGRLGRRWESPQGCNIYTSIVLRPPIAPRDGPKLTMLAALAVSETLSKYLPSTPSLKWPNDVLIGSRKISGILAEMDSGMGRVNFIVIGIGINVNAARDIYPADIRSSLTSLKEEIGMDVSRVRCIQMLYRNMERWYKRYLKHGFSPVRDAWERLSALKGRAVAVRHLDNVIDGIALGIDEDGALILERAPGMVERIISGDLMVREQS